MMNRTVLAAFAVLSATAGCVVEGDDVALGSDEQATCNVPTACQPAINDFNADPSVPGTLAWRAAGPFTCDYACNMGMQPPVPGFPYAWTVSTLKMRWSWSIFHRDVTTTVETRAYCANWQYGGTGDLSLIHTP